MDFIRERYCLQSHAFSWHGQLVSPYIILGIIFLNTIESFADAFSAKYIDISTCRSCGKAASFHEHRLVNDPRIGLWVIHFVITEIAQRFIKILRRNSVTEDSSTKCKKLSIHYRRGKMVSSCWYR